MIIKNEYIDPKWILWGKYERVRLSGKFNMITEAHLAAKAAGLTKEEYLAVVKDYGPIKADVEYRYGSVDKFLKKNKLRLI